MKDAFDLFLYRNFHPFFRFVAPLINNQTVIAYRHRHRIIHIKSRCHNRILICFHSHLVICLVLSRFSKVIIYDLGRYAACLRIQIQHLHCLSIRRQGHIQWITRSRKRRFVFHQYISCRIIAHNFGYPITF